MKLLLKTVCIMIALLSIQLYAGIGEALQDITAGAAHIVDTAADTTSDVVRDVLDPHSDRNNPVIEDEPVDEYLQEKSLLSQEEYPTITPVTEVTSMPELE